MIQTIKRGKGKPQAEQLHDNQLGWDYENKKLYIKDQNNVNEITQTPIKKSTITTTLVGTGGIEEGKSKFTYTLKDVGFNLMFYVDPTSKRLFIAGKASKLPFLKKVQIYYKAQVDININNCKLYNNYLTFQIQNLYGGYFQPVPKPTPQIVSIYKFQSGGNYISCINNNILTDSINMWITFPQFNTQYYFDIKYYAIAENEKKLVIYSQKDELPTITNNYTF